MAQHNIGKNAWSVLALLLIVASLCLVPQVHGEVTYELQMFFDAGTVSTNPVSLNPDVGYIFNAGTVVTVTVLGDDVSNTTYRRFVFESVYGEGAGHYDGSSRVFPVTMNENIWQEIVWQLQYEIAFDTSGISGETGSSTIVTVDGVAKTDAEMPFLDWYDLGSTITFTYSSPIVDTYVLSSVIATFRDASGHLISDSLEHTYGVLWVATITGIYTIISMTTTSTMTTLSTTMTSTASSGDGGYVYTTASTTGTGGTSSTSTGAWGGYPPELGFDEFLHDLYELFGSEYGSSSGSGSGAGNWGGMTMPSWMQSGFGWLQESTCVYTPVPLGLCGWGIPNWMFVFGFLLFLLLAYDRERKKKKR